MITVAINVTINVIIQAIATIAPVDSEFESELDESKSIVMHLIYSYKLLGVQED